jgi:hypothetical protein
MRKKKEPVEELARTDFPVEPSTLTMGQIQKTLSKPLYARKGDFLHWRCAHPLKGKVCPFEIDETAASTGYHDFPDKMVIHVWEEGHYSMGNDKLPVAPGRPRTRDDMIEELLENMDEAHKDLTIALDRYGRETREVIDFLRKN